MHDLENCTLLSHWNCCVKINTNLGPLSCRRISLFSVTWVWYLSSFYCPEISQEEKSVGFLILKRSWSEAKPNNHRTSLTPSGCLTCPSFSLQLPVTAPSMLTVSMTLTVHANMDTVLTLSSSSSHFPWLHAKVRDNFHTTQRWEWKGDSIRTVGRPLLVMCTA